MPVDLVHIEEEVAQPDEVMEWFRNLPSYRGQLIWSEIPKETEKQNAD